MWIAAGNEAAILEQVIHDQTWSGLRKLRDELAHQRLPDIDEDAIWRTTTLRAGSVRAKVREPLR